jgi:hypothetical protein
MAGLLHYPHYPANEEESGEAAAPSLISHAAASELRVRQARQVAASPTHHARNADYMPAPAIH